MEKKKIIEEGYCKGDACNRNGCKGVIEEREKDGCCSCHINPPCSYCTEPNFFCNTCGWDAKEEQAEYDKAQLEIDSKNKAYYAEELRKYQEARDLFYKKYRGELEAIKFEYLKEPHTHFSMRVLGVYPKGFDLSTVAHKYTGTFGGRFLKKTETSFEYIAYTD